MDATTIVLPPAPAEPGRPTLPLLAAVVPVLAGIVLWAVTGSMFALAFAALGPLMLVASFVDGRRSRRRERRRTAAEADAAWQRAEQELERLHTAERQDAWRRDPDVAACLKEPPLRGRTPVGADTRIVLGRGLRRSAVRASGGDDERSRAFRSRAETVQDAPVTVPLGGGVCVRGAEPVAAAMVRALVAQLCLRHGGNRIGFTGDGIDRWGLHELASARARHGRWVIRLGDGDEEADAVICVRESGDEPPDGVTTVVDLEAPERATVRTAQGTMAIEAECLSAQQARRIGTGLAERLGQDDTLPDVIGLTALGEPGGGALAAALGRGLRGDVVVDLVEDGPHAVVAGMTGTGKSELLVSWVAAIARAHAPEEVSFVLVDFKGGTAFDPLRRLPHVVAVITDLDDGGATRGVGSLTAELRRREGVLAAHGARDIAECAGLGRLVIVVDEFAALLQEHPDLAAVFTDVAARGRALGMHLILGTQRASGVVRDALAANCPLRISLRVAEPADSRFVIGSDAAATLPGGAESRGLALVRRPRDGDAQQTRIALTSTADLDAIAGAWPDGRRGPSPWLPPLPTTLVLPERGGRRGVVIGRADHPDEQRQPWVRFDSGDTLAIIGGTGAGKSTALRMLAGQLPDAVRVPTDLEAAWDVVAALDDAGHEVVLCDDLDLLMAQYPPEYAQQFAARWERLLRRPGGAVITMSRVAGGMTRLVEGAGRRVLLRTGSKVEHLAAGGDPGSFRRDRVAGRGSVDGVEVQLCWAPDDVLAPASSEPPLWTPPATPCGIVTAAAVATADALAVAHPDRAVTACDAAQSADEGLPEGGRILVGDPEQWRASWSTLQSVRLSGELLIAAECAGELRQLGAVRHLPPYAHTHAGRAWLLRDGAPPVRVRIAE